VIEGTLKASLAGLPPCEAQIDVSCTRVEQPSLEAGVAAVELSILQRALKNFQRRRPRPTTRFASPIDCRGPNRQTRSEISQFNQLPGNWISAGSGDLRNGSPIDGTREAKGATGMEPARSPLDSLSKQELMKLWEESERVYGDRSRNSSISSRNHGHWPGGM
jgi:hypothetical protein